MKNGLRILLFDIETAPLLGYTWGVWEQDVIEVKENWYILSFAAKWLGESKVTVYGLPDFKGYKKDKQDDRLLVQKLHEVFSQADVLVGHNGDRFDVKKANARFAFHRLTPPEPYKTIDTLKIARGQFKFDSNKLDDLGHYLGVGRKLPHTGKRLWLQCMAGDLKAWKKMKAYNKQDVVLLERVYKTLLPWATRITNFAYLTREVGACPRCQSKKIRRGGVHRTLTQERQRYQCHDCGGWFLAGNCERLHSKVPRL